MRTPGVAKRAPSSADGEVAGGHELAAGRRRDAVHARDHGLRQAVDRPASAPSRRRTARGSRRARSRPSPTRSCPAQKAGPSPRSTTTCTPVSAAVAARTSRSSRISARERALRRSGPVQRHGAHAGRVGDQEGWRADGDHGANPRMGDAPARRSARMTPSDSRAPTTTTVRGDPLPRRGCDGLLPLRRSPVPRRALGAAAPRSRPRRPGGPRRGAGGGRRGVRRTPCTPTTAQPGRRPRRSTCCEREGRVEVELRLLGADGVTRWVRDTSTCARPRRTRRPARRRRDARHHPRARQRGGGRGGLRDAARGGRRRHRLPLRQGGRRPPAGSRTVYEGPGLDALMGCDRDTRVSDEEFDAAVHPDDRDAYDVAFQRNLLGHEHPRSSTGCRAATASRAGCSTSPAPRRAARTAACASRA